MSYVALKLMTTVAGQRMPGDLVPEAASWPNLEAYKSTGYVRPQRADDIVSVRVDANGNEVECIASASDSPEMAASKAPKKSAKSTAKAAKSGGSAKAPAPTPSARAPKAKASAPAPAKPARKRGRA